MIPLRYSVQRNVPASTRSRGVENCRIALIVFSHPGTGEPQTLCVNEQMIQAEGPDPKRQQAVIEREIKTVLAEMTAGAEFLPVLQ
jgi:hypothetical protein